MTKFVLLSAAAAFLAAPAFADTAATKLDFTRDGVRYVATETVSPSGVRTISGDIVEGGSGNFVLYVKKGWVTGYVNGQRVAYREPVARSAGRQLASR